MEDWKTLDIEILCSLRIGPKRDDRSLDQLMDHISVEGFKDRVRG